MKTTEEQSRAEWLAEKRAAEMEETKKWAAKQFNIKPEKILDYGSGSAYSKIWVTDRKTAEKVSKQVEKQTCNGGYFHGMALGAISEYDGKFEVMV